MCKVNGRQTTDAKWWQKLTLPLARWAKNMSLSIWSSSSSFSSSSSLHPPSSSLSLLSCTGTCHVKLLRSALVVFEETGQNTPTFFQNKNYFTKTLPILFAKMACLIKKNSTQTTISCVVIQDLSSKFIYCLVLATLIQLIQHSLSMING